MIFDKEKVQSIKAWPFEEALKLVEHFSKNQNLAKKDFALFETGYGPSGLPHIGTFGEIARTSMVRFAFEQISSIKTRLFCFSDDMDGLRKIPSNIPNSKLIENELGKSLTKVPDPFGKYPSFGEYNNAKLRQFLDSFGFDYEFCSSTKCYKSGKFDEILKLICIHYDEIQSVMLPTLRQERRETYSPFLPICPKTGIVLQVPIHKVDKDNYTVIYEDPITTKFVEVSVTGGDCKLQWKVDWAMRWCAFGVDYEMCGKDLIDSYRLSSQICRILGFTPPCNLIYELFLDDKGQKISKSKGNG
ncbi:MAG: lysine--tRNA ligase, partial [Alphaproteobacteria bacterium]